MNEDKVAFSVLYHGSPVPYEITDADARLKATIANLNNLPGNTIVEIRLLSPLSRFQSAVNPFSSPYFSDLTDRQQLMETAIAAELCNKEILLFNFGVNYGKYIPARLQTLLNIRALKQVFAKISGNPFVKQNYGFSQTDTLKQLEEKFFTGLENQNPEKYDDLPQDAENTNAPTEVKSLYREIMILLKGGAKNNFKIATKLAKLCDLLKNNHGIDTVAVGCNDGKDRTGEFAIRMETNVIVSHIKDFHLLTSKVKTTKILEIRKHLREHSTAATVAQNISMPGGYAVGLDIKENKNRDRAKYFKLVFKKNAPKMTPWKHIKAFCKAAGHAIAKAFSSLRCLLVGLVIIAGTAGALNDPANTTSTNVQSSSSTPATFTRTTDVTAKEEEAPSSGNNAPSTSSSSATDPLDDQLTDTEEYSTGSDADSSLVEYSEDDESTSSPEGSPKAVRKRTSSSDTKILQNRNRRSSTASPIAAVQEQPPQEIYIPAAVTTVEAYTRVKF